MHTNIIAFTIFLIFTGAAILATAVLFTRQSLLVAYILLGAAIGPWGLQWVGDAKLVNQVGDVGIIFLLFLLGLHLTPQNLLHMLRKVTMVALVSSLLFAAIGFVVSYIFGFTYRECFIIAAAMMFSSTIIGLKLLPTTILHHQHTGEIMISVLLMQDFIAIAALLLLHGAAETGIHLNDILLAIAALPILFGIAYLMERYVLVKLLTRFDKTQEYIFLLSIGWCLGMAQLATVFGLSLEIGAFIAGVALAASPISLFIAESLKPLRDFFLVMFFFAVGAEFNFHYWQVVLIPALILTALLIIVKPLAFKFLLKSSGETAAVSGEVGWRLGQASEFSLLIASIALGNSLIGEPAAYFIQATTIFTFIVSSYIVVLRYPTPIALSDKMRSD